MWLGYSTLFQFAGFIVLAYGFTGSYTGKQLKTMFASDSNENIGLPSFLHQHPSVVIKYNDSYRENRFYLRPCYQPRDCIGKVFLSPDTGPSVNRLRC